MKRKRTRDAFGFGETEESFRAERLLAIGALVAATELLVPLPPPLIAIIDEYLAIAHNLRELNTALSPISGFRRFCKKGYYSYGFQRNSEYTGFYTSSHMHYNFEGTNGKPLLCWWVPQGGEESKGICVGSRGDLVYGSTQNPERLILYNWFHGYEDLDRGQGVQGQQLFPPLYCLHPAKEHEFEGKINARCTAGRLYNRHRLKFDPKDQVDCRTLRANFFLDYLMLWIPEVRRLQLYRWPQDCQHDSPELIYQRDFPPVVAAAISVAHPEADSETQTSGEENDWRIRILKDCIQIFDVNLESLTCIESISSRFQKLKATF